MFDPFKRLSLDPRTKKILYFVAGCIGIFILLLLIISLRDGQSESVFQMQESQEETSLANLSFTIFVKLVLVVGIIYGIFFAYRWWQSKNKVIRKNRLLVKESVRLSPKQAVHILRVDDKEFLIGATDQQISLLSTIDPESGLENVNGPEDVQLSNGEFKEVLQKTIQNPFDVLKGDKKNVE